MDKAASESDKGLSTTGDSDDSASVNPLFDRVITKLKADNPHLSDNYLFSIMLAPLFVGETRLLSISSPRIVYGDELPQEQEEADKK